MNFIYRAATVLFLLAAGTFATPPSISQPPSKGPLLKMSGTITRQVAVSSSETRLRSEPLNDERLFAEFAVSQDDYAFVFFNGKFSLLPRSQSSSLPELPVFTAQSEIDLYKSEAPVKVSLGAAIASSATGNLFEGLAGEATGSATVKFSWPTTVFKDLVIRVYARGKDTSSSSTPRLLLRFKVTQIGNFEQNP